MERHAIGIEPKPASPLEQFDGHFRSAAELARERPIRALARDQNAAEHPRAGGATRQLFELGRAVEGEEPHPRLIGEGDVLLLLDRVAEGQPFGRGAVAEAQRDLGGAGDVEIRALPGQHRDDLGRRVGLHRIIDAGDRQIPAQHIIGLADQRRDRRRGTGSRASSRTGNAQSCCSWLGLPCEKRLSAAGSGMAIGDTGGSAPRQRNVLDRGQKQSVRRRGLRPRGGASRLAQTAWIGGPATPPTQAGAAENGVRAGRDGPDRDCNHIDLPLGTGKRAGLPKRTRYVVA